MPRLRVAIVGGGFSGLATAYFLSRKGAEVSLYEAKTRLGGLISSTRLGETHLSESAANGLLSTALLESLARDLNLELISPYKAARARFIFSSQKLSRWPLSFKGSASFVRGLFRLRASQFRPRSQESLEDWGARVFGKDATLNLIVPALRGIYAGDSKELSATLIYESFRKKSNRRSPRRKGLVSLAHGMESLIQALESYCHQSGVKLFKQTQIESLSSLNSGYDHLILACGPSVAAHLLQDLSAEAANQLKQIEMLPLVSVTAIFPRDVRQKSGFGVVFSPSSGFHVSGVLFNSQVFAHRSPDRSETWIFGGALDRGFAAKSEDEIREILLSERQKIFGLKQEPLEMKIHKWPQALPHYNLKLEALLAKGFSLPQNVHLIGNYLGQIGLAKILERSFELAEKITEVS